MSAISRAGGWTAPPDLLVGRVAGAGLLVWMGWIHLHLWSQGYKHLPSIGHLFLLNFIAAVLLAVIVLAVPRRYLTLAAGAGALMAAGTLVSLADQHQYRPAGLQGLLQRPVRAHRASGWRGRPWLCSGTRPFAAPRFCA